MSQYSATIVWQRHNQKFIDGQYSRAHEWEFDGGARIAASASPQIVPLPQSVAENVDPEEAFVAALSSCHMLFFLSIAAKRRYLIDRYVDTATGILAADDAGNLAMTRVVLRPKTVFSGTRQPTGEAIEKMHHQAHDFCFIANSVKTRIDIEIQ